MTESEASCDTGLMSCPSRRAGVAQREAFGDHFMKEQWLCNCCRFKAVALRRKRSVTAISIS
jgi:hypothetical protein